MKEVQEILNYIDLYSMEIVLGTLAIFFMTFLIRSFKRSLLISEGQARLVLESYDHNTDKLNKWMSFVAIFLLLPLIIYAKFLS